MPQCRNNLIGNVSLPITVNTEKTSLRVLKMSKQQADSDGFQLVSSKRFSRNKQTKIPPKDTKFDNQETIIDVDKAIKRIQSAAEYIRASDYWNQVIESVSTVLNSRKLQTIVCFGLGHIGECNISRYQLALLLCFKDFLNCPEVLVHDPVFLKSECDILSELGLKIIPENTEGGYVISKQKLTLLYLPHCPKQLTNNFLWTNWGPELENCILICNSFAKLVENQPNRILKETVPFIEKITSYVSEISLNNNFIYTDIFNDTSIHYFPNLEKIDIGFWIKGDKPDYENTEEFITSLMVEKLNI